MKVLQDTRQTDNWAKYLNSIGWKTVRTSSGILIAIKKLWFFSLVKIQKPQKVTKQDLEEIEQICKKEKYFLIKLEPYLEQDENVLVEAGYSKSGTPLSVTSTMLINLEKDEKELWEDLAHSARYSINRSKREGSQIRYYENPTEDALKNFYDLFIKTAKRQKFYQLPYTEVLGRCKSFGRKSYLVMAYNTAGELSSAKLFLGSGDLVLYSIGGTSEESRKTKIGYEMLWNSILYLKGLRYKVLDLEGIQDSRFPFFTSGWDGFSYFKEKFGGTVIKFPSPYVKFSLKFFSLLNKIIPFSI